MGLTILLCTLVAFAFIMAGLALLLLVPPDQDDREKKRERAE